MRNLVTIQKISNLIPIPDADCIELAQVLGWKCVVKKGEFKVGDMGVYFEVDSYLPIEERYEFLRGGSYRKNAWLEPIINRPDGFRIKTQCLRGCISQGLLLPLKIVPEVIGYNLGDDVTDVLNVVKWEVPEVEGNAGTAIGRKPFGIPTTDETRVQSLDVLRVQLYGLPYYISTKMDGTSCTIYANRGKVGVCGRNDEYKDDTNCGMWNVVHRLNLDKALLNLNRNIALQGEFCGEGIQKNRLRLREHKIYIFNAIDVDTGKLLSLDEMLDICNQLGVETVPIEERGDFFNYTMEELLKKANGKYPSGLDKEGIVIRPITPIYCPELHKSLSFKVLNNDFLKKEK